MQNNIAGVIEGCLKMAVPVLMLWIAGFFGILYDEEWLQQMTACQSFAAQPAGGVAALW